MYVRVTRGRSPVEQVDRSIEDIMTRLVAAARRSAGYAGTGLYVIRETGEVRWVTFWESARALAATARWASLPEHQPVDPSGLALVDVERLRLVLLDNATSKEARCSRVDNGYTELERQDDWAGLVLDQVVPPVRAASGYCAMAVCVDRTTGAVVVQTDWESAAERDAAAPLFTPVLRRAAEFTLTPVHLELFGQAVTDWPISATP